jgi:hypothetical protein
MHGGHSRTPSNQSIVKYISYDIQNSLFLETGSHYVDQAILKIIITQPQAPDLLGLQKLVIWLK